MRITKMLMTISVSIVCTMFLKAGDTADNYLFRTMTLPITKEVVQGGELTLSVDKDFFDEQKKERELLVRISPSNSKIAYTIKDEIIVSVKILVGRNVIYENKIEQARDSIFPIISDGTWAVPIINPIANMLKFNVVKLIDKLNLKNGESAEIKISDISRSNIFAYELFFDENTTMKVFESNTGFTAKQFISQKESVSIIFQKGNIQFINYSSNHAIETNIKKKSIVVMNGINDAIIYSYTGKILERPQFNLRINK